VSAEIETLGSIVSGMGIMFGNIFFLGTFLLALTSVRDDVDPKWLGWLGMLGSVVTFPWFFFVWAPPILQMIPAFGFAIVIIWMIVMGVRMARTT
jgi:ABC-type antimicrobial peptide transport system permease subunit